MGEEFIADGRIVRAQVLTEDGQSLIVDAPSKRIRPLAEPSPGVEDGPVKVAALVLGTRNMDENVRFWSVLLGKSNVRVDSTGVQVTPWLRVVHDPNARGRAGSIVIDVYVPDPVAVARRINPNAPESLDGSVDVYDPDGRLLRLHRDSSVH